MKKSLSLLILFLFSLTSYKTNAQAYSQDKIYLNAGVSFAFNWYRPTVANFWTDYQYSFTPPLVLSVEKGFSEYLSAGVYGAHRSYGWDYEGFDGFYENRYTRMSFGARVSFHYVDLLNEHLELGLPAEELDLYVTGIIGFNTYKRSITEPTYRKTDRNVNFFVGPVLGARYFFTDKFGLYIEGGRGSLGFANGGLTFKL